MSDERKALDVLLSIESLLQRLVGFASQSVKQAGASSGQGAIAPDRDLDGKWGDPEVKAKDPRDWTGPTMKGRRFSECPPEYLDLVADRLEYFAEQAEAEGKTTSNGKPVAPFNRADAARARGWAKRIRTGEHIQSTPPTDSAWGENEAPSADDIPF